MNTSQRDTQNQLTLSRQIVSFFYKLIRATIFFLTSRMSSGSADGISPRSILLVMPMKGIGDFILSSPVVKNVRRQWPNASIEAVVRDKKSLGLSSRILPVDRYHPWSFDWLRDATRGFVLLGSFRRYGFDIVIDFMCDHSVSSALFSFLVGAPCTAGFSCSRRKLFFNHLVVPDWSANHITDDLHRLASSIGVQCIDRYPSIVINDDELNYARAFLEGRKVRAGMPLVSIHPGARDDLTKIDKRWHWMRFRALCRQLVEKACVQILVLGSHEEKQLCEKVTIGLGSEVTNACGCTSVLEVLSLIGSSDLFIGNNSGLLHMASALGVPTISFSGGINMARWAPLGSTEKNRVMMPDPECSLTYCPSCTRKGKHCLDSIEVEDVVDAAYEMLSGLEAFASH